MTTEQFWMLMIVVFMSSVFIERRLNAILEVLVQINFRQVTRVDISD